MKICEMVNGKLNYTEFALSMWWIFRCHYYSRRDCLVVAWEKPLCRVRRCLKATVEVFASYSGNYPLMLSSTEEQACYLLS